MYSSMGSSGDRMPPDEPAQGSALFGMSCDECIFHTPPRNQISNLAISEITPLLNVRHAPILASR